MNEGLKYALCALSYFKSRHGKRPMFKAAKKRSNQARMVCLYEPHVYMAREYIRRARAAGWRGSVREAVMRGEA